MKTKIELSEKQIHSVIDALRVAWGDYDEIEAVSESCGTKGKEEMEKLMEIFERGLFRLIKSKEVEKRTKYLLKKLRDSQKSKRD